MSNICIYALCSFLDIQNIIQIISLLFHGWYPLSHLCHTFHIQIHHHQTFFLPTSTHHLTPWIHNRRMSPSRIMLVLALLIPILLWRPGRTCRQDKTLIIHRSCPLKQLPMCWSAVASSSIARNDLGF
jgi:hypothetical protein